MPIRAKSAEPKLNHDLTGNAVQILPSLPKTMRIPVSPFVPIAGASPGLFEGATATIFAETYRCFTPTIA
jgi:hypothetical protein